MKSLQVQLAPTAIEVLSVNLSESISLPDPEAAESLNRRMAAWVKVDRLYERSFVERGLIIREFEKRQLWKYLIDPETGETFPHLSAWLSSADYLGCRRTNFESKRILAMLADVPAEKLIDVPKANLHTLTQLSTAVRNDPEILEAARTLPREKFEEKLEREQPHQHIEVHSPMKFHFGRSQRKAIEAWVEYATNHNLAGTREEAVAWACEEALDNALIDERLDSMPAEEVTA